MRVREHTGRCGSKVSSCLAIALSLSALSALSARASAQTLDGALANAQLGRALAMQGGRLVVGELVDGDETVGRAYVYDVRGASPVLEATLSPFGPENAEHFGMSVAIDGDRVFVGAPDADAYSLGALYVFERQSDGRWLGVQRLVESPRGEPPRIGGPDNFGGFFGWRIVPVGDVLAVSAPYYDRWRTAQGAVVFFTRDAGTGLYTQALLVASPATTHDPTCSNCELFGFGLAFDGHRLAASNGKNETVYLWDVDTSAGVRLSGPRTITRATYADATGPRRDLFGWGLAYAGSTLFAGARNAYVGGLERGAVLAIDEASGTEELVVGASMPFGTLPGTPSFGTSIVSDGDLAAIGGDDLANVRVLERVAGRWRLGRTITTTASYGRFGSTLALEGGLLAIGAPNEDTSHGAHAGRVSLHWLALVGESCDTTTLCASGTCDAGLCVDGVPTDAGIRDAGPADARVVDASPVDASPVDASPVDASPVDASPVDASPADASPVDASLVDASPGNADAGLASMPDTGLVPRVEVSCACRAVGGTGRSGGGPRSLGILALLVLGLVRRRRLARHAAGLALLGSLALSCPVAQAQATSSTDASTAETTPPSEAALAEARARFQLAQAHYAAGSFADAAEELERAYALSGRDAILYNLHLAYREMGDVPRSAEALRRYLAVADEDDLPVERRALENRLAALERTLAASRPEVRDDIRPDIHPDIHPDIRGELRAEEPSDTAPQLAGEGLSETTTGLDLAPGAIVLGVGGASLVASAILGAIAASTLAERDHACSLGVSGDLCPASYDQASIVERFVVQRDVAWALFAGGLGVAATGAVLLVVGASDDAPSPVSATCGPTGCELAATMRF
ncbi:MAG: hypothetical protein U0353_29820 [Sandaracinus sp.]